jgi:hypothetical protein
MMELLIREREDSLIREAEHERLVAVARAASRTGARPGDPRLRPSRLRLRLPLRLGRLVAAPWFAAQQPYDGVETR